MNGIDPSVAAITRGILLLQKFDPYVMDFLVWQNSFEYIVDLLKIPDNKKVFFLLCMIETNAYICIQQKLAPLNPFDLGYDVLISMLEEFFSSHQGKTAARYRFDIRNQIVGESVKQYANALKKIIDKCCYGIKASTFLIIRFVIGLKSHAIQLKLLQTPNVTFDNAVYLAERMEFYEKKCYDPIRLAAMNRKHQEIEENIGSSEKILINSQEYNFL
ncbi:hypothetical protein M0804_013846 [Polistes exclamans]|nr:hypothetical protein M0804_013846 [Polistes exclamans]